MTNPVVSTLTGKIGPLPVWAWGAIGAVGIRGAQYLRDRKAAAADTSSTDTAAGGVGSDTGTDELGAPVGYGASGAYGSIGAAPINPGGSSGYSDGSSSSSTTPPTDNYGWINAAQAALVSRGYDPVVVSNALNTIIAGGPSTPQQQAIYSQAVRLIGSPPDGTPIITNTPPPVVNPPKPPASSSSTPAHSNPPPSSGILPTGTPPPGAPGSPYTQNTPTGNNTNTGRPWKPGGVWLIGADHRYRYLEPGFQPAR